MKYFWATLLSLMFIGCGSSADNTPSGLQGNGSSSNAGNQAFGFVVPADSGQLARNGDALTITLNGVDSVRIGENGEGGELTLEEFVQRAEVSDENSVGGSLEYRTGTETKQVSFLATRLERTGNGALTVEGSVISPLAEVVAQDEGLTESFQEATFRLDSTIVAVGLTGSLIVTVTDQQGSPLPGVLVTATPLSPSEPPRESVTAANGVARYPALTPDTYTVMAQLVGFQTGSEQAVVVRLGGTTRIEITLVRGQSGPFGSGEF